MSNSNMNRARAEKRDEFYTCEEDISREVHYYEKHFKGKTVLCNCDDPRESKFFKYFSYGFEHLKLNKLISTCYKSEDKEVFSKGNSDRAIWLEYDGDKNGNRVPDIDEIGVNHFDGDGDFRSAECIEFLKQADIVVTNPPFSLWREYIAQLVKYEKKFLIIGNQGAATYKDVFPLIRDGKIWMGRTSNMKFRVPDYYPDRFKADENGVKWQHMGFACWWTNLDHEQRHEHIKLTREYNSEYYPYYDNYKAIEVDSANAIPKNWGGGDGCSR